LATGELEVVRRLRAEGDRLEALHASHRAGDRVAAQEPLELARTERAELLAAARQQRAPRRPLEVVDGVALEIDRMRECGGCRHRASVRRVVEDPSDDGTKAATGTAGYSAQNDRGTRSVLG